LEEGGNIMHILSVILIISTLSLNHALLNFRFRHRSAKAKLTVLESGSETILHLKGAGVKKADVALWTYVEKLPPLKGNEKLMLKVRGNGKIRITAYIKINNDYRSLRTFAILGPFWNDVVLPLKNSKALWTSNFPYALIPEKDIDLYLFIENAQAGSIDLFLKDIQMEVEQ